MECDLFGERPKKHRQDYRKAVNDFKAEHRIWTCKANDEEQPWSALLCYENDSREPIEVIAEEAIYLHDTGRLAAGNTEREAVRAVAENFQISGAP